MIMTSDSFISSVPPFLIAIKQKPRPLRVAATVLLAFSLGLLCYLARPAAPLLKVVAVRKGEAKSAGVHRNAAHYEAAG
jgi:hypothetical protein